MRRRSIVVALALAACVLGALAPAALAVKEKPVFGKFKASLNGAAKGSGEAGEMTLGPYHFEECERELKSNGSVTMGESETFLQEVRFNHCLAERKAGGGLKEQVFANFTLGMEFHSNGSLKLGPSAVTFGASNSTCEITIPSQWVPAVAETAKGAEKSFGDVTYETELEELEGSKAKKYGPFRERLDIEWTVGQVRTTVKLTETCKYEGAHLNEAGEAEFDNGRLEGELEEVTLTGGNLGFAPPPAA